MADALYWTGQTGVDVEAATRASPDGVPHVRVTLGSLRRAVTDLAAAWAEAAGFAARLWPEADAFDRAERAGRNRIARRGAAAVPAGS